VQQESYFLCSGKLAGWWEEQDTVPDRYPLPSVSDFSARISGSKVFSKLELQKGYYQVPMRDQDIIKTAVVTPFGLF